MAFEVDKGAVFSLINLVINPSEECIAVIPTVLPIPLAGGRYITILSVSLYFYQARKEGRAKSHVLYPALQESTLLPLGCLQLR